MVINPFSYRWMCPFIVESPVLVASGDLSDIHAFTVRYRENEDRLLDTHVDSSDVTLNLCLGGSFEGGDILSNMTQTLHIDRWSTCFWKNNLKKTWLNGCHSVIHNASQLLFAFWSFQRCGAALYRWCLFPWPCWWGPRSHDLAPPRGPRALLSLSSQSSAPQWYSLDSPGKSHPRSPPNSQGTPQQFDPLVPGRPKRGRPSRAGLRCRLRPVLPEAIHGNDAQWCAYMRMCYCRIMLKQVPIKMLKLLCNRC